MKRLVVSLLRLGDIMMMTPALQELKRLHPEDELHLLINEDFQLIESLLGFVDHVHFLPRRALQSSLGDPETPILEAFDQLEDFCDHLASIDFEDIYNLTHNKFSAYICSAIGAKTTHGMYFDGDGFTVNGHWFEVLNEDSNTMPFHFSEVFLRAVGSDGYIAPVFTVDEPKDKSIRTVLIQAFSNEAKKMWSISSWRKVIQILAKENPSLRFRVLAAPFEKSEAFNFIKELHLEGIDVQAFVCDLPSALKVLQESELLITVDTSIKHLASATSIKIIELALGSSEPRHTGVFREGALIIRSAVECAPCPHSEGCSQADHRCSVQLDPLIVGQVGNAYLGSRSERITSALEKAEGMDLFETKVTPSGSWLMVPRKIGSFQKVMDEEIEPRISSVLRQSPSEWSIGSSAFSISDIILQRIPKESWQTVAQQLTEKESLFEARESEAVRLESRLKWMLRQKVDQKDCEDFYRDMADFTNEPEFIDQSKLQEGNLVHLNPLSRLRGVLTREKRESEFKRRFYRTVKLQMMEKI